MNLEMVIGRKIHDLLTDLEARYEMVIYSKIEDSYFLKLPEQGIYFEGYASPCVTGYRIYFLADTEYFPADEETRGEYSKTSTISEVKKILGSPTRDIRSLKIPGRAATHPGIEFKMEQKTLTFYYNADEAIVSLHTKLNVC
ncbi:MAG: hypothetical protein ACRYF9_05550 [Janthinobacterium lividum]|uniref:hypothetical protein n=1 Tax=Pseudomonas sp. MWU16-30317 TaxID=2878095 RepID=UPI001CFAC325|nr:hypothetical protein [Pseudomonas sp. MWU16-30317]